MRSASTLWKIFHQTLYTYRISVSAVCEDGSESAPSCVFEIATAHTNPPAPGPPELDEKTHNTICLKWTHDINDATHINSYLLTYKETSGESWETLNTVDSKKTATVLGRKPNTAYVFRVSAEYGICKGDMSVSSDPYMTHAASSPSDLRMFQAFQRKIKVVWNLPTFISEGLTVNRYKIRYQPAQLDGHVSMKESKDDTCSYHIDHLLPNTAYLVSVSAVCSEDGESAYSTPVEMKTLPRNATQLFNNQRMGRRHFQYSVNESNSDEDQEYATQRTRWRHFHDSVFEFNRDKDQENATQRTGRTLLHDSVNDSNSHKDEENGGIVRRMWHYFRGRISKKNRAEPSFRNNYMHV